MLYKSCSRKLSIYNTDDVKQRSLCVCRRKTSRRINPLEKEEISELPSFFLFSPLWTHLPIPLGSNNKIKEHLGPIIYRT